MCHCNNPDLIARPFDYFCKICQRAYMPTCTRGWLYHAGGEVCPRLDLERSVQQEQPSRRKRQKKRR